MKQAYKKQAKLEALELIERGHDPESLVQVIEFPQDYYLYGKEYFHLSTPLPHDCDLSGHICEYYTLSELAK